MAGGYNLLQDTGHMIATGEVYQLAFHHAGFAGWDAADTLDVELFYDDGTRQTLFNFNINPASGEAWNQLTTNFPAITDAAAAGNTLWLNFSPVGASGSEYVSIDEVSLAIPDVIIPPTTNITISTVAGVSVSDDYHQSSAATLTAGLGTHTSLVVNGTANLDGTLQCALPAGFSAAYGERFTILSADSISGTFSNADGMLETGGHHFRIHYAAGTVELEKVAVTAQGTPHWWLDDHSLATDLTDTDGDGLAAWQEYITGTDPTQASSGLTLNPDVQPLESGFVVRWPSETSRFYDLHSSTNLTEGFRILEAGIAATPPQNTYTDSTANAAGFYRVQAERD
jgi:hypothetical protein